jgi:unspecific monooxygenase
MAVLEPSPAYPPLPHPRRRLPLVGDVLAFDFDTPTQSAIALAAELGPIYELKALGVRYIVAAGAEAVIDLNDETRFCKHVGPDIEALRVLGGDGLFTAYNDEPNWLAAHELLMPAFSRAAMRRYHDTMLDVAEQFTGQWDRAAGHSTVDVSADTTRVTLETIGRCAAGYSFEVFERDGTHPFVEHMVAGLKGADRLGALRASYLPNLLARIVERSVRRHGMAMAAVADDVIAARREQRSAGRITETPDLLDLMLDSDLDVSNIRYQLINFLVAGHETTSGALSFALYFLSRHPEVAARCRAEIDAVWGDAQRPEYEQVTKLRYVRRTLDEALRLQPTVPGYYRSAREDTVLAGMLPMRKGDWVLALTPTLHRDPRWGPNPDAFDPDRFEPERVRACPAGLYKPFGTGTRSCIGRQFALHEAVLLLGVLLRRYDLIADPAYELNIAERLTLMPKDFRLALRRR